MNVPKNTVSRRIWVCAELHHRGTSLSQLARDEGVSSQSMSAALSAPSSYLEPVIAAALGLTAQELFPERFLPNGERLSHTREQHRSTKKTAESCPKYKAA